MANAAPQALAVADHVADHHDADGAAHAIRQIILEGLPPNRGRKQ
jgi:hydroxymethylpyrimidine pyrophosphatase-like HAD family hydrolase